MPEGIGIFQPAKNRWTIWGEWKDGLLNGKIMKLEGNGDRREYECKAGKIDGNYIRFKHDGGRYEEECQEGICNGVKREYDRNNKIIREAIYQNQKWVKEVI